MEVCQERPIVLQVNHIQKQLLVVRPPFVVSQQYLLLKASPAQGALQPPDKGQETLHKPELNILPNSLKRWPPEGVPGPHFLLNEGQVAFHPSHFLF